MAALGAILLLYQRLARRVTGLPHAGIMILPAAGDAQRVRPDELDAGVLRVVEQLGRHAACASDALVLERVHAPVGSVHEAGAGHGLVCVALPASARIRGCVYALAAGPHQATDEQVEALRDVAEALASEVALRIGAGHSRALETMVRMLGKAVENMQLGVTLTDLDGTIVYTNPAEARMHGFQVGELVGQQAHLLAPRELCRALDAREVQGATSWTRESINLRKDGTRFPVLLWSDQVTDAEGRVIGIVTCSEDITQRKHSEQALRDFALRDPLTGLPNRVHFLERLNQAIARLRVDESARFAVLFLDLDRFKVVNDSLGHHVGDELIRVVAARLLGCLRPSDAIARFGGDEFAVLLEEVQDEQDALAVAQRVVASLAGPVHLDGYELFTSASVGVVMSSPAANEPEYLWRSADMAMYRAKGKGAGQVEIFDRTMHADALARLELETDLRRALERNEFELHYQPIVQLEGGRMVGVEALLRWRHPRRGLVLPAEIIPVAEETGMILRLGEWVVREGCRQLRAWQGAMGSGAPGWVGVNLSSKQLNQPNLLERVQAAVQDSGIRPEMLKLEITESGIIENTAAATEVLRRLKGLGIQLYLDDFGTGYSSLSYLHRLPLDALKIDRSFISRMSRGGKHASLVQTILQLARNVNLRVVAEGVSTPGQLRLLQDFGCEFAQGFLFSHPLPGDQLEAYLRGERPAG